MPRRRRATSSEEGRDLVVRIAGEGRKYGLYLLMVTQRPEKLEPNALTQCDNLMLLRLNGRGRGAHRRRLLVRAARR